MTSSPPVPDEMDVDTEEEEDATPRPRKRPESGHLNLREDDDVVLSDDETYKTPSVLVRTTRRYAARIEDSEESNADEQFEGVGEKVSICIVRSRLLR
jgi:hypothetical protein